MKCEFDSTSRFTVLKDFFIIIACISVSTAIAAAIYDDLQALSAICFTVIFPLSAIAGVTISFLQKGTIIADENLVIISHKLFKRDVLISGIYYDDIDCIEYQVKHLTGRFGFMGYRLVVTIKYCDENEIILFNELDISENMPTEKPDEYKKFLANCPMVKLCKYINKRANGRFADET